MSNQINHCPMCNQPLKRQGKLKRLAGAYGSWRSKRITTLQSTALTPWQPPEAAATQPGGYVEASRVMPIRAQNLESDFLTPLAQALGTGFFVMLATGLYAWQSPAATWVFGVGCGLLAAGIHWLIAIIQNPNNLRTIETIIRQDIDGDGVIGEPAPAPPIALEVVHKSEVDKGFRQMFNFELPAGITEADFYDFAKGVTEGSQGLAQTDWTGSNKPFSKPKYQEFLGRLDSAGIVEFIDPKSPTVGRRLTTAGRRALLAYVATLEKEAGRHRQAGNDPVDYDFIEGVR